MKQKSRNDKNTDLKLVDDERVQLFSFKRERERYQARTVAMHKCNSRCHDGDKMAKFLTSGSTKQDVLVGVVEGVENLGLDRVEVGEAVELLVLRVLQCAHL